MSQIFKHSFNVGGGTESFSNNVCSGAIYIYTHIYTHTHILQGFPGGIMDENLPANAGDSGLIPGLGRFHMPRNSTPQGQNYRIRALETMNHNYRSLCALELVFCNRSRCNRKPVHRDIVAPAGCSERKPEQRNKDQRCCCCC